MTEEVIRRDDPAQRVFEFCRESGIWAVTGFALELACDGVSASVGAAALAAGISGRQRMMTLAGGVFGALLHGFPVAADRLAALGIVLISQIIPQVKNTTAGGIIRGCIAMLAVCFSRVAGVYQPSQLLTALIASLTAGAFAACVYMLSSTAALRGFDISEPRDCTLVAAIAGIAFMTLGALDYPFANIGRLAAGFMLLTLTARRGLTSAAVFGIPAVWGMCAASPEIGAGAALTAFAAVMSGCFTKYGKITRTIGFIFFGGAGALCCPVGTEFGSWRLLAEMAAAGLLFVVLPVERIGTSESEFSDSTVAMMLRERLCFAADAIAGVSSGLNAAADTLERRYSTTIEQVSEDAAERACRSCPNSMVCWGQKYELFKSEFERLVKQIRTGNEITEQSMSPQAAEECISRSAVIKAVKAAYSGYMAAAADERRIRELRRIYVEQLASVHDILEDMGYSAGSSGGKNRSAEKRAEKALRDCGLKTPTAFVSTDKRGRIRLEAYGSGELRTEREYLGELLITALGRELELPEVSSSGGRVRVTTVERTRFSAEIGVYQLSKGKNRICGDCYDTFTDPQGMLYIILSDGMGSGSRARIDSALACSMTSRLLKSGISLGAALETVNTSLMVKSSDESFATLDICRIDLNTGECTVFKAGAATTYIKCNDRLIRVSLSSPPAGTGGKLTIPAQRFTVGNGDIIIMTTDGVAMDEEWLSHELSSTTDPQKLSEKIARTARSAENGREDDISVIAVAVGQ